MLDDELISYTSRPPEAMRASGPGRSDGPPGERYRRILTRLSAFVGIFSLVLAAVARFGGEYLVRSDPFVGVPVLTAEVLVRMLFGSPTAAAGTGVLFVALWFGVRWRSSEVLLLGMLTGVAFLPLAVLVPAAGFAILGLFVLYYSYRARQATFFRILNERTVPDVLARFVE